MTKQYGTPGPRALYPSAATSQSLAACDPMAQLLFDRVFAQADDQGRLAGDASVIKALCMPLIPKATPRLVAGWLDQLVDQDMLIRYEVDGRQLTQVNNWWSFQGSMRRCYPSRWPPPEGWPGDRIRGVDGGDSPAENGAAPQSAAIRPESPPSRAQDRTEPNRAEPVRAESLPGPRR